MKKTIKISLAIVVVLATAVSSIPYLIPVENVKNIASNKMNELTGRDLTINGKISATIWPNIGINIQGVSISNPKEFETKNFAEIDELNVGIALIPLLSGNVEIKEFSIIKPTIHLEKNKNGNANWEFSSSKESSEKTTIPSETKSNNQKFHLNKLVITDGTFTFHDESKKSSYNIEHANATISMSSSSALNINADMLLNKEKISTTLNIENALSVLAGNETALEATAKIGSLAHLDFSGKASLKNASGNINLNIPSLISLASWANTKTNWNGKTALAFAAKGEITCTTTNCDYSKAVITLDNSTFNGNATINFASTTPSVDGKFSVNTFDLNNYINQPEKKTALSLISNAHAANWDNKPIDLSGLRAANIKLSLNISELIYESTIFSNISAWLNLTAGNLAVDIPKMDFYNGTAKINAHLNPAGALSLNVQSEKIQIEPLLKDFANFDQLTGSAAINLDITGSLTSQHNLVTSLNGKGKFDISDGIIRGIDLAGLINNVKAMVTGADTVNEKTKFSELGGTFKITQGIVSNNDLSMKAPLLRMKGEGTVDLVNRYVKYHILPSLVASLKGQGGKDKEGLEIPVMVEGNFESLTFTPNFANITRDVLKDPEKIKDTVKSIKETIKDKDGVKNLLKGFR